MNYSMYNILKSIVHCCGGACLNKINIEYSSDTPTAKKNKVLLIEDVVGKTPLTSQIYLRGEPKNGASTSLLAFNLLELLNKKIFILNDEYKIEIEPPKRFTFDGVDDFLRTQLKAEITIKCIKRIGDEKNANNNTNK